MVYQHQLQFEVHNLKQARSQKQGWLNIKQARALSYQTVGVPILVCCRGSKYSNSICIYIYISNVQMFMYCALIFPLCEIRKYDLLVTLKYLYMQV